MSFTTAHSPSPSCESPSPSPSTSALPDQPPRKRSRSEMSSEERKEARAHRNRIAAQNSRDRRKAQFGWLERRVAELEEENRRLRAGLPTAPPPPSYVPAPGLHIPLLSHVAPAMVPSPQVIPVLSAEDAQRAVQDRERERENEELKERIRTLERGWDAVVKALQQQGLPTGLPAPAPVSTSTTTSSTTVTSAPSPVQPSPSSPSTSSAPTAAPPTTTTQLSTGFPSPAPSQISEFDFASPSSPAALSTSHQPQSDDVTARHLAAGGSILSACQGVTVYPSPAVTYIDDSDDDDARMEDLFREILVEDSSIPSASAPLVGSVQTTAPAVVSTPTTSAQVVGKTESKVEDAGLGKRKREEDEEEEESGVVTKKKNESEGNQNLSFDGLDSTAGLDFAFEWTDSATTSATATPLSPEELQQMLHQFEATNTLFPNDLGLEMGAMDMSLPLDLGTWNAAAMTGVF
ncbi:hypothetical protein BKA70DRAFT_1315900 [Coprinopsis sp. MPI-PUGE-AT-0042]|nr:hypothetical protein BKA70DRAFT_1315900 [Coprinopsis sp. MPI-PUGE-AT-0042]